MAGLFLDKVTKQYPNGVVAVRDLTLEVADGDLLVLVGPSGCGKTTALRLIAGLEEPTQGIIRIGDQVVNRLPSYRRNVALVFQRPALYPYLTVRENLAFGLRLRSRWRWWQRYFRGEMSEPIVEPEVMMERVTQAARLLGLETQLDRLPGELSGGQQQRVALGRAMVRQPDVFLLDEPLSGLDAPLRAEMRRELHLLHRRLRTTMIYVTHEQAEAMVLGDRVAVLQEGILQQMDRPEVLYDHPRNRFVAGFVGWPPMNFVDGQVVTQAGQLGFQAANDWFPWEGADVPDLKPGQPVTLGLRPHKVTLGQVPESIALTMEVSAVEKRGEQQLLTLQRPGWQLTALLDCSTPAVEQQTMTVSWDMKQAHWFDRSTGMNLSRAASAR